MRTKNYKLKPYMLGDDPKINCDYIAMPAALLLDDHFANLSASAKILYGFILDRAKKTSVESGWRDEYNRLYIDYPIADIMKDMCRSEIEISGMLRDLELFELIRRTKQKGYTNLINIKSIENMRPAPAFSLTTGFRQLLGSQPLGCK